MILSVSRSRRLGAAAAVALLALSLAAGCSAGDGEQADPFAVRDSAGVAIAENRSPAIDAPFRLAAEPVLVVGGADETADPLFRVRGARRLVDGGIVVANGGSSQLRFYAPDGTLRESVGTKGGGPGEFQALAWIGLLPGDSVLAFDSQNRRYTVFDAAGTLARSYQPAGQSVPPRPIELTAHGAVLSYRSGLGGGPPPNGLVRDTSRLLLVARDGTVGDTIARVPGDERMIRMSEQSISILIPPFSRRLVATADDTGYWVLRDGGYEIARHALDGRLERLIRLAGTERATSPEMMEMVIARNTEGIADPAARQSTAEGLRALPLPERLPAVSRLLTDPAGNLWAQDFTAPADTAATWRVFDRDGRYLGALTMPQRLTVYEVGDDFVLGVHQDDDDVEEVRVYGLSRGE